MTEACVGIALAPQVGGEFTCNILLSHPGNGARLDEHNESAIIMKCLYIYVIGVQSNALLKGALLFKLNFWVIIYIWKSFEVVPDI